MRLGWNAGFRGENAEDWAEKLDELGVRAIAFPISSKESDKVIESYRKAAVEHDILIAEVGIWNNPISADKKVRTAAIDYAVKQLKLADEIGANCCVNIAGADGPIWDGAYMTNLSEDVWKRSVEAIQEIVEKAAPKKTYYSIEPMPYMFPTGPDEFLKLIRDTGSDHVGIHLDMVNWMNSADRFFHQRAFMDEVFEKFHGMIHSCHFKDCRIRQELTFEIREAALGKGDFDIDYLVKKVNEEDDNLPLLVEHLKSEAAFIRSFKAMHKRYYA